jgi:predicted PurR-regulated permease PerM
MMRALQAKQPREAMKEQSNQVRFIATLAAIAIALYLCWLMLRPFIGVLAWATVLVIFFHPIHKKLTQRIKRRGLCALLSSTLVILIVVIPLTFLTIAVTKELTDAVSWLPPHMEGLMGATGSITGRVFEWIHARLGIDAVQTQQFVLERLRAFSSTVIGQTLGIMGNLLGTIFKSFLVIITMYYLFRDGDKIVRALPQVLPFGSEQSEALLTRIDEVIGASVYGVVTIAMLQGLLAGLAFWVLGVPSPILWAVVLAFVCMIPIAGSFMVWLPAAIYLLLTGHVTKGILLIVWGVFVISTIDNFLRPKLIKNKTRLHELFVFFAVLGGMSVFGLLGVVLGPVVLAVTLGLLETLKLPPPRQA